MSPLFGYHIHSYTYPGVPPAELFDHVVGLARGAESAGFDLITVMDHLYQIRGVGSETEPMLEAYTTLAAIAASTTRMRVGTLVTGVTYRNPALLAKIVTTLDVISKGRALLGIGAAWNDSEHAGYGYDFPPIRERMDRLDEALTICRRMFAEERPSFAGRHYRIERALNVPRPIQAGGPPILIGGVGEQRTLRLVARHADIAHWFAIGLDGVRHKRDVLERHCEAEGRDPATIQLTTHAPVILVANEREAEAARERLTPERRAIYTVAAPEHAAEVLRPYQDAGIAGFTFGYSILPDAERLALAGELKRLLD